MFKNNNKSQESVDIHDYINTINDYACKVVQL